AMQKAKFEKDVILPIEEAAKKAEAAANPGFDLPGSPADRWSIGTVLWEIYGGHPLFDKPIAGGRNMASVQKEQEAFMKMSLDERRDYLFSPKNHPGMPDVPKDFQDIILGVLDPDGGKRMDSDDALKKPIFQNNDNLGSDDARAYLKGGWRPKKQTASA
ncbi:MAG: hypothetical protein ABIR26_11770, partial [Ramlibacter sp.]